jgi:GNAT superfamily N-acetyltransferase
LKIAIAKAGDPEYSEMQIINFSKKYAQNYFMCLEEWSEEMKEAGNHKELWFNKMKEKGIRVKLAVEDGKSCGMIQYMPIEQSFAEGKELYFINCIWVHGYKEGVGNYQKKGIGKLLLSAAEDDVRTLKARGMVAWGLSLPFWMKASWFRKQGYKKVDKNGIAILMWKAFDDYATPPKWIKEKKHPTKNSEKISVVSFKNGWCPAQNLTYERAKRASKAFGDLVIFEEIDTFDREVFLDWGISDALFIDGKQIRTGPPPSYKKIHKKIAKRVRRISH